MRTKDAWIVNRLSALGTVLLFGLSGCAAARAGKLAEEAKKTADATAEKANAAENKADAAAEKADAAHQQSQRIAEGANLPDAIKRAAEGAMAAAEKADKLGQQVTGRLVDANATATALQEARKAADSADKAANEARNGAEALEEAARLAKAQKLPNAASLDGAAKAAREAAAAATNAAASARRAVNAIGVGAGGTVPQTSTAGDRKIELGANHRVEITLPQMPPTRTYCTLDEVGGSGESVTVDWDPLAPRSLVRTVTLAGATYEISCHSEAARQALDAEIDFSWMFMPTFRAPVGSAAGSLSFCDPRSFVGERKRCNSPNIEATIQLLPSRTTKNATRLSGDFAFVPAMGAPSARSGVSPMRR